MGSIYFFMYEVLTLTCMVLILLWIPDYRYGSEVICECKCYGMGKWMVACMSWNSMVLQVELATGEFPYKDCKTDFEVLTKVLQDDPPLLTPGPAYSHELCSFIRDWLVIAFIYILHCGVFLFWKNSSILGKFNRASAHDRLSKFVLGV